MYDPVTFGFWYYNTKTEQNTWDCPVIFQKTLFCPWDGFQEYGGSSGGARGKKCRCVFDNVLAYQVNDYISV